MRRYRALSRPPGAFCAGQSWADCITNTAGSDFRQGQVRGHTAETVPFRGKADVTSGVIFPQLVSHVCNDLSISNPTPGSRPCRRGLISYLFSCVLVCVVENEK